MPGDYPMEDGGIPLEVVESISPGLDPGYLGAPVDGRGAPTCDEAPRRTTACDEYPRRIGLCEAGANVGWAVYAQLQFNFDFITRAVPWDCEGAYDEGKPSGASHGFASVDEINFGTTVGRWYLSNFDHHYTDYSAAPTTAPPLSWRNHPQRVVRTRHFLQCLEGVFTHGGWDGVGHKFLTALPKWGARSITVGETTYDFPSAFTMAFFLDEVKWPRSAYNVSDPSYDRTVGGPCCVTFHPSEFPECFRDGVVTVTEWSFHANYTGIADYSAGGEICAYTSAPPDLGECTSWEATFPALWWYSAGTSHGEIAEAGRGAIEVIFGYNSAQGAFDQNSLPQPDAVIVRIEVDISRVMDGEISTDFSGPWTMELVSFRNPIEEVLTVPNDSVAGRYYNYRIDWTGNYTKRVGFTNTTPDCTPGSGIPACYNIGGDYDTPTDDIIGIQVNLQILDLADDSCQ